MLIRNLSMAVVIAAVTMAAPAMAIKMPLKSYHKEMFTNDDGSVECSACHGDTKRYSFPDEAKCISCHGDKASLAEETARPGHGAEFEPNPHDSLHYGQDLSCVYCHSEHKKPKVYCNQCHEFKYPDMKRK